MPKEANKLSRRTNGNLLQLWLGRNALTDEDVDILRDELERRGVSKEVEEIVNQGFFGSVYGPLPPGPRTYFNLSVLFW